MKKKATNDLPQEGTRESGPSNTLGRRDLVGDELIVELSAPQNKHRGEQKKKKKFSSHYQSCLGDKSSLDPRADD